MSKLLHNTARSTLTGVLALALLTGCDKPAEQAAVAAPANTTAAASPAPAAAPADALSTEQFKAIVEEGFIYGLPLVMNYAIMNAYAINKDTSQFKAPFNQIKSEPRVYTYKDTTVLSPNSDTPYSLSWLDLRAEPIVLTVPKVEAGRYYSIQLVDASLYNGGYIGSRATGNEAGSHLVVGPDWHGEKPAGIDTVIRSTTPFMFAIYRTQLFNPADMPNVEKIQAGYKVQPLSAFQGKPAPAAAPVIDFLPATTAGIKTHFWSYLSAALELIPITEQNQAIRAKLATIGIAPGVAFDIKSLAPERQQALVEAMKAADAKVTEFVASGATNINGWQVGSLWGDSNFIKGDWLKRAGGAKAGIYGNDAAEAMYLITHADANEQPLDGSKHNYTITFPAGSLPPVKAFWSVTMYYGDSQLLVENPINRYLINSPMLPSMNKNADGSVTLYVQHKSPGKDKEANWLPAPDGPIYLALRMYWPTPASDASSVLPPGKGTWGPPGIVVAD